MGSLYGVNVGFSLKADATSVYVTGQFHDDAFLLYHADGTVCELHSLTNEIILPKPSVFLVKYTSDGRVVWGKKMECKITNNNMGRGLALDPRGTGVYITGYYDDTKMTVGDHVILKKSSTNTTYGFLIKMSEQGEYQWSAKLGGVSDHDMCHDVAVDGRGDVYGK
jgi:hypothetical protein